MKKQALHRCNASTLVISLVVIACIGVSIAASFQSLVPKYRGTHQSIVWQETLHGADAGVELALDTLNTWTKSNKNPDTFPWTSNSWTITDSSNYSANGERTLASASLPVIGGPNNVRVTKIAVDVYTREGTGTSPNYNPWFRIRSTARADLPGKYVSSDSRDVELRRMKLAATTSAGIPDPHVTRTVEVVVRPRYRSRRAITSVNDVILGHSTGWEVDSFDSQDTLKSSAGTTAGGIYPGSSSSKVQTNGNVASAKQNPASSPYGPLIAANGALIRGDVKTNGGDDPATAAHENVSDSSRIDQSRILSDFNEEIQAPTAPTWTTTTYSGTLPASFVTGTKASPTRYNITGNLGTFAVTAPASTTTGYIEIIVSGNLSTGSGSGAGITIPPNVYANIWVQGNVDFSNAAINSTSTSSKVASRLSVYGVSTSSSATYVSSGNGVQILTFDGPNYSATLNGTVETTGSFVVKNFLINGGGGGGVHYDEELGRSAPIDGWDVASYFEDSRGDL